MGTPNPTPLFDPRAAPYDGGCRDLLCSCCKRRLRRWVLEGRCGLHPMLPDTLHKLPQEERFAYAKVLAFMTRVDDELTVDEMAMFEQRLGTALLSPNQRKSIRSALKVPPPLEECMQDLGPEAGRLALRDSVLMAAADGNVDEDELEALNDIANHLGLAEGAVDRLLKWTEDGYAWMNEGYALLNDLA